MKINLFILWICVIISPCSIAQETLLDHKEAVHLMLQNNLGIKIVENETKIAKNNQSILNTGFLPSLSIRSGINYNIDNTQTTLREGEVVSLNNIETSNDNLNISANYMVFDGLGRLYNYKKFKSRYQLSEIDAKIAVSETLIELTNSYYKVARMTQRVQNLEENLKISKDRIERVQIAKTYGQKTTLDILNAEVDISTDSIYLLHAKQELRNAKWNLNLIMNVSMDKKYKIDTTIVFLPMSQMLEVYRDAEISNFMIQKSNTETSISQLDYKLSKSQLFPKIFVNGGYNIRNNNNSPVSFATRFSSDGITYGASLSWNIFDTGKNINQMKNSKIQYNNTILKREEVLNKVRRDIKNHWNMYLNNLYIYQTQGYNVAKNKDNFNRSLEKYHLGHISSIVFRKAQIDLLNSENDRNVAKYNAKKSEIQFLYTAGKLLEVKF